MSVLPSFREVCFLMARTGRFCFAVLLAGVVAASSKYEQADEQSDFLCKDDGIGCSPGGAFDTSGESSFDLDDLFKEMQVDTHIRDELHKEIIRPGDEEAQVHIDQYKEMEYPADVNTQIRENIHKEDDHYVDTLNQKENDVADTQVQYVQDIGNHKVPESSAEIVVENEAVADIVKHPGSDASYSQEKPSSVVELKVPVRNDTDIVSIIDTNLKGTENGGKTPENSGNWPNSLHETFGNIPSKQKPYIAVNSNSYYSYQEPGDNGKMEVYSYWGPGTVVVKEPPKKPPGPKPKPENSIMNVGSSLLREIVRVPLAIKSDLERFAMKLLKFTGKGVKGLIKEAKRILLKIHDFFRDGTNVIIMKIEELLRYVISLLSGSKMNLPSGMT